MENPTTVALSRLMAQARAMDVTAANLANANTPGYRAERPQFATFLVRQRDGALPPGESRLAYAQDRATYREDREGTLTHTGNPLDLAINGDGYFAVRTRDGARLTRAGHFSIGPNGELVDAGGDGVLDTQGDIIRLSPADTVLSVAADGTLASQNGRIGQIGVVAAAEPFKLVAEGATLFDPSATTTAPIPAPRVVQGAVEDSNVQPVLETTRMMGDLREFQFVTQFVQGESERQQSAIDKILPRRS